MARNNEHVLALSSNAFGKLVKSFREQRGWSQNELAERWGHSREYVSLLERGKRKVDKQEQVDRLANILEIPPERLEAVGRLPPRRSDSAQHPSEADDVLLHTLLQPALSTVKLSWLLWQADGVNVPIAASLSRLISQLDDALTKHRGEFLKPAQQVLAYANEMMGKIAFDQLRYIDANGHFQEMLALGEELKDPDIMTLAQIHLADILRKRGRYETAVRLLSAIRPLADTASPHVRGTRWQILARAHFTYGQAELFEEAIDQAQAIAQATAQSVSESIEAYYEQFNLVDILQERAQGYTMLWQPRRSLEIYQQTDQLKPFRPLRELGSYTILKAQAYAYNEDLDTGIDLALQGIKLARGYHSRRHLNRVQVMYDRLHVTPLGKHPRMRDLREALLTAE